MGVQMSRPKKLTQNQIDLLLKARHDENMSYRELSKKFGIVRSTAWMYVKAHTLSNEPNTHTKDNNSKDENVQKTVFTPSERFVKSQEKQLSDEKIRFLNFLKETRV